MPQRLYQVVKSVTGHEVGDKVPASSFVELERLVRKGVVTPTEEFVDDNPDGSPYRMFDESDLASECERLADLNATLESQLAERNAECVNLKAEIEKLRTPAARRRGKKEPAAPRDETPEAGEPTTNPEPEPTEASDPSHPQDDRVWDELPRDKDEG